jgi:ribosomal protein S18 acetylase RimI-like enzyme
MPKISIVEAVEPKDIAAVERLLRDYLLWMRRRYHAHLDMIDAYFDEREWQSELANLPGRYGAPFGAIVLALVDGVPAGCVMMRGIGCYVSEMKRLFVRPAFRGMGLARKMVDTLMGLSCKRGYAHLRFETSALQAEAEGLYRSMGFQSIPPYYACSDLLRENGRFFEAKPCRMSIGAAWTPAAA